MEMEGFQTRHAENFKACSMQLDTSTNKLRQKYKWLEIEWPNKTNQVKNVSGFGPDKTASLVPKITSNSCRNAQTSEFGV